MNGRLDLWSGPILSRFGDRFSVPLLDLFVLNRPPLVYELLVKNSETVSKGKFTKTMEVELAKGLLSHDGEEWAHTRRILAKDFTPGTVSKGRNSMSLLVDRYVHSLKPLAEARKPIDMTDWAFRLGFEAISTLLFKQDLSSHYREAHKALDSILEVLWHRFIGPLKHVPSWFPLPILRRARAGKAYMHETVKALVHERLRQTAAEPEADEFPNLALTKLCEAFQAGQMSEDWLIGELVTLYVTGHETTGRGISWMCYALASEPELQDQLYDEARQVGLDDLSDTQSWEKLALHRQVVDESLRLYPSVPGISRSYDKDVSVQDICIPKGSKTAIMIYVIHRHPEFWERAGTFDPMRFTAANRKTIPLGAYLPFGLGPRRCLGSELALSEMTIVLAHLMKHFKIRLHNPDPIHCLNGISMRPTRPVEVQLIAR